MPKLRTNSGAKNLISDNLKNIRKKQHISQRGLAQRLQLAGYDMDKNIITRIETNKRYVSDFELKAFCQVLNVTYEDLLGTPHS